MTDKLVELHAMAHVSNIKKASLIACNQYLPVKGTSRTPPLQCRSRLCRFNSLELLPPEKHCWLKLLPISSAWEAYALGESCPWADPKPGAISLACVGGFSSLSSRVHIH